MFSRHISIVSTTCDWTIFLLSDSLIGDSHRCCRGILGITLWTKIKRMCPFFSCDKFSGTTQVMKMVHDNRCCWLLGSYIFGGKKLVVEYVHQIEFLSFMFTFVRKWLGQKWNSIKLQHRVGNHCAKHRDNSNGRETLFTTSASGNGDLDGCVLKDVICFWEPDGCHRTFPTEKNLLRVLSTIVPYWFGTLEVSGVHFAESLPWLN